jgi:hypothetical protein
MLLYTWHSVPETEGGGFYVNSITLLLAPRMEACRGAHSFRYCIRCNTDPALRYGNALRREVLHRLLNKHNQIRRLTGLDAPSRVGLVSGSCPSGRGFAPRFLQAPPRDDALALR